MKPTNHQNYKKQQFTRAALQKIVRKRLGWFAIAISALVIGAAATMALAVTPSNGGSVGGSTSVVDNTAGDQGYPHVSGNLVAYTDYADPAYALIRYYDFLNPVTPNASIPSSDGDVDTLSDVNGNDIAFSRYNPATGQTCMIYDVVTHLISQIGTANEAGVTALGGDTVAFVNGSVGEILVGYISNPSGPLANLSTSSNDDMSPAVSPGGNVVVWASCGLAGCAIMKSTQSGGVWGPATAVTAGPATNPDTDGTNIVYDYNGDIFIQPLNGGAATQLVIDGMQRNPSISGGVIAFESSTTAGAAADLFVYQASTNTVYRVTDTLTTYESLNDVTVLSNGDVRVVWAANDDVSGPYANNIYARTFSLPLPAPSYQICLLYDGLLARKSGTTYPIKLQLCDTNGQNLSSPSIVLHAISITQASTNAPGPLDDTGNANPDFDFRYDATLDGTGRYIFNLSLRGLPTGTYNLDFRAGTDPALHSAPFAVR
jgi:hypothetical protein